MKPISPVIEDIVISISQGSSFLEQSEEVDRHQFLMGEVRGVIVTHSLEM